MRHLLPVLLFVGCDDIPTDVEPCPEDTVLSEAALPCDCQGAIVEELSCGELVCSPAGLATGGDGDSGCTSSR